MSVCAWVTQSLSLFAIPVWLATVKLTALGRLNIG